MNSYSFFQCYFKKSHSFRLNTLGSEEGEEKEKCQCKTKTCPVRFSKDKNSKAWTYQEFQRKLPKAGTICLPQVLSLEFTCICCAKGSHLSWEKQPGLGHPLGTFKPLWSHSSQLWQHRSPQNIFAALMQSTNHIRKLSRLFKGCHPHLLASPLDLELPHFNFEVNHSLQDFLKISKNLFLPFSSATIIFHQQNCGWVWDNPSGKTQPLI